MHRRRASLPPEYEPISLAPQIIPSSQSISISNASQQRYQSLQTLLADIGVDKADPDSHHLRGGPHLGCVGDFTRGSDHHAPKPGPSYARTAAADPSDARALVPHAPVSLQWPHSSVMDLLMQQALAPYDPNLASVLKGHRPSWTSNMGLGLSPSALADAITSCLNSGTDGKILALSLPLTRSAQPTFFLLVGTSMQDKVKPASALGPRSITVGFQVIHGLYLAPCSLTCASRYPGKCWITSCPLQGDWQDVMPGCLPLWDKVRTISKVFRFAHSSSFS